MIIQTGGGACGSFRVSTHAPFRHDGNRFHRHFLWIFHTEFNGIVDFREGEGGREGAGHEIRVTAASLASLLTDGIP